MAYASLEIVKTFDSDLGLMLVTTDIGRNSTSDARLVYIVTILREGEVLRTGIEPSA